MIKVLLAEDVQMVRGALVALLGLEHDIDVVASIANGDEIVPAVKEKEPNVAVLDIDLPGLDGLSAAAQIHDVAPGTRTLILTSLGRPGTLRRALDARVNGFILKDAPISQLTEAIRAVSVGRRVIDSQLALSAWDGDQCPLTPRELEVLRLTSEGADAMEIANTLYLSVGTIRNYLTTVTTKLEARNRIDAVRIARKSGWL
ncbi:response regulator transcription factor [Amycolatopsis cihanbeyliensis]|uniref:LuxR family two component transcriptional regulator n=1 Tax=Amycolatopsis cihanbeyliensis TaxID=1128664 RepID=A0A542DPY3_AMYCI|nr:response regulator transcription factor [Amycolatopsis cihanbeyliensis]TQJ05152.1 LuxR family two component transcriptional regulator [Amycolatopsis cihanbeyliensis]